MRCPCAAAERNRVIRIGKRLFGQGGIPGQISVPDRHVLAFQPASSLVLPKPHRSVWWCPQG